MKKTLALLSTLLLLLCGLSAQKRAAAMPLQLQTIDSNTYVVEYVPLEVAQKTVQAQIVQTDKQLQTIEKQLAEMLKKRDGVLQQKAELEYVLGQLKTPPPAVKAPAVTTPQPDPVKPAKPAKKPKKKKN